MSYQLANNGLVIPRWHGYHTMTSKESRLFGLGAVEKLREAKRFRPCREMQRSADV
jgi:hypothetical protein